MDMEEPEEKKPKTLRDAIREDFDKMDPRLQAGLAEYILETDFKKNHPGVEVLQDGNKPEEDFIEEDTNEFLIAEIQELTAIIKEFIIEFREAQKKK